MPSYVTILSATIPVFLVIAVGFFLHRRGILNEQIELGVMKMGLNCLIPCFILTLIPGNPALKTLSSAAWAAGLGFGLIVIGYFVAWGFGLVSGIKKGEGVRTFAVTAGIQNYGYLPLPIVLELFPDNKGPSGLIFVHGLGVELAMWTVGLAILVGKANWRSAINGPFLAVVAALILNYTGAYLYIPEVITTTMEMIGRCAIPMAILMIGATMARFFQKDVFHDAVRIFLASSIVRLLILACVILAAAKYLPISDDLRRVLVIQAAMPTAIFPIMLARMFGGRTQIAIQVVVGTSLVSLISSPLVIALGFRWVGV